MKTLLLVPLFLALLEMTGCSLISTVATSNRMEEARTANLGKDLVPKDGGTYLIPIATETISYLGSGNTDWKINDTAFSQPKGSFSQISVIPGIYSINGNKRVAGGGEASAAINIKKSETICFYVINPISAPARVESFKNDACDPLLRSIKNLNVVDKIK